MPEYLAPGVYVEEVDTGPKPIEGVSTSTAGMVGAAQMGPVSGLPQLVTSFADYQRLYGGFLPEKPKWEDRRYLAYAVQGFFQNGGQRVYIQRVVGDNAAPASRELNDGYAEGGNNFVVTGLAADMEDERKEAVLVSSRGIEKTTQITFRQQAGAVVQAERVQVDTVEGDRVTWQNPTNFRFTRGAVVLIEAPEYAVVKKPLKLNAVNPGEWGQRLRVHISPSSRLSLRLLGIDISSSLEPAILLALRTDYAANDAEILLKAGNADQLRPGDRLKLTKQTAVGEVEYFDEVKVQATDIPNKKVILDAAVNRAYPKASSTVELVPAVAYRNAADTNVPQVKVQSSNGFQVDDRVVIDADEKVTGKITAIVVATKTLTLLLDQPLPGGRDILAGTTIRLLNAGRDNNTVRVAGASNLYPGCAVELEHGKAERLYGTVTRIQGDAVQLSVNVPPTFEEGDPLRSCEFDLKVQMMRTNPLTRREEVVRAENHQFLSLAQDAPNHAVTRINADSYLLTAESPDPGNPAPFNFPTTINPLDFSFSQSLQNGADGDPPQPRHYRGTDEGPGKRTGIMALEDIDEISIIAAPGITDTSVQGALSEQCERLMDRFAVLDGPLGANLQAIQSHRGNYDTKYAALYHPWLTIRDSLTDAQCQVPPSGHMIGIYARVDVERGVHKAPANEVIRGTVALEQIINKREQDILNPLPRNINVLRDFRSQGRAFRVWGARCLTSDAAWKYIPVRRLFIFIEESLNKGTQWVVFEPNDEPLWARVRQSVSHFLTRVWRDGALMGSKPEEAFFIKCDRTTMTQDDIDNGRLIMVIGIAPVKPAEYVIIRIGQWAGGSQVEEQ